jgi:hypothetical protein
MSGMVRRPVITFGVDPIRDLVMYTNARGAGSVPEAECDVDTVDVTVARCSNQSVTVPDGFTFAREPDLVRQSSSRFSLVVCNDPVLKKGRP